MKTGDLVRFKKESANYLSGPGDPKELYPFKFEIGIVTGCNRHINYRDEVWVEEVFVCFPSGPDRIVMCSHLEVIS